MPRPLPIALLATYCVIAAFQQPAAAQSGASRARQAPTASLVGLPATGNEIRAFFDEYLRLHEAKDMTAWPRLFLEGAVIVRTGSDGRAIRYSPADLAARIADEAATLESQHEIFEDVRIEADGDAAMYSTHWKLFHNGKLVREGRAWFLLARDAGHWRIASLVWYNH